MLDPGLDVTLEADHAVVDAAAELAVSEKPEPAFVG